MTLDYRSNGNCYPNPIDKPEFIEGECINCGKLNDEIEGKHFCSLECECMHEEKKTFEHIDFEELDNVVISGIDRSDYPDFVDAYIESADYEGIALKYPELETATEVFAEEIQQEAAESLF